MIPVQKPSSHLKNQGKAGKVQAVKRRKVTVPPDHQELILQIAIVAITMGIRSLPAKEAAVIIIPGKAKNM
jgi:hypothetical protein